MRRSAILRCCSSAISRTLIQARLGKPAASYRYEDHDVDIYAFFQGYSQAQQFLMSSGKVLVIVAGVTLVIMADAIVEEAVYGFHEDPPEDKTKLAAYEARKREHEEQRAIRRDEEREERAIKAAAVHQEQMAMRRQLAKQNLEPEDLDPEIRAQVRGETLHFDNHENADGSRHLVFAVNYDSDQKLNSVAFLTGLTKARGDVFGRGPEVWFKKRGNFPLQDVRQSIFQAPPEKIQLLDQVTPLPPLD